MNTSHPGPAGPSLRRRTIGGGIVVGVLALAWWWSGLNHGPGPGEGGNPDADQTANDSAAQSGNTDLEADDDASPSPGYGDRLTVRISGTEYFVSRDAEFVPATLADIVALAQQMPGDETGVRVRIEHDRTGVSGAQTDLEQALANAGLTRDQWQTVQQAVE